MIDYFALALAHALLLIAVLRISVRSELDREDPRPSDDAGGDPPRKARRRA